MATNDGRYPGISIPTKKRSNPNRYGKILTSMTEKDLCHPLQHNYLLIDKRKKRTKSQDRLKEKKKRDRGEEVY